MQGLKFAQLELSFADTKHNVTLVAGNTSEFQGQASSCSKVRENLQADTVLIWMLGWMNCLFNGIHESSAAPVYKRLEV